MVSFSKYFLISLFSIISFSFLIAIQGFAQEKQRINNLQDSLRIYENLIKQAGNDSVRFKENDLFTSTLNAMLEIKGSFELKYDSIKMLFTATPEDKAFRLYTWALPKGDGSFSFYGFIQFNDKISRPLSVIKLIDASSAILNPLEMTLEKDKWYGAVYYKVIQTSFQGKTYYTLLGWKGINAQLTSKVIDILVIDDPLHIKFGYSLFKNIDEEKSRRVIFKYASSASMYLGYDEQFLPETKRWNKGKRQFEKESKKSFMIVCDELVPENPILEGQYEFYIPSSETYNAFVFTNGYWVYTKNIDARNK